MRIGQNPAKYVKDVVKPARVTVAVLNYIPFLSGFYAEGLDVLSSGEFALRPAVERVEPLAGLELGQEEDEEGHGQAHVGHDHPDEPGVADERGEAKDAARHPQTVGDPRKETRPREELQNEDRGHRSRQGQGE